MNKGEIMEELNLQITQTDCEDEIKKIKQKAAEYYQDFCGYSSLEIEKLLGKIEQKIRLIFKRVIENKPLAESEIQEMAALSDAVKKELFTSVYGMYIPSHFYKTPLGRAIEWVDSQVPDSVVGQVEAAKILGKPEMWVWRNKMYLGAYNMGGRTVFDREIIQRFKDEILKDNKRLQLEPDYWYTPLGQLVKKLNQERAEGDNEVGVDYVWRTLIKGKRSRYWIYQHAEELGGKREGKRLTFNREHVEKIIKERAEELGLT